MEVEKLIEKANQIENAITQTGNSMWKLQEHRIALINRANILRELIQESVIEQKKMSKQKTSDPSDKKGNKKSEKIDTR